MQNLMRANDEAYLSFAERLTAALDDGLITYDQWCEKLIGDELYETETLRRCSRFFKKFLEKLDGEEIKILNDENRIAKLEEIKHDIEKERKKLQTANLEYHSYLREDARHDMLCEKVAEAIEGLDPIPVKHIVHAPKKNGQTGLLCISDLHAGSTYEVHGLYGETVNMYDFEIMQDRLWKLVGLVEADCIKYDQLVVGVLGDLFEGILRVGSLTKLREPVIDTVIKTSEFLCQWIAELQNRLEVPVRVVTIGGNHDITRNLTSRISFEDENLTKIVVKFMEERFKNHRDITIDPYTDVALIDVEGTSIMLEHGEDSSLQTTMDYFSNLYNVDVDEIYAGHLHRPESKAVGITELGDRMIYRVGSICGVDSYAKRLRKSARPSAYFALYEKDQGHTWSRTYYL